MVTISELSIGLGAGDADQEELAQLTSRLQDELSELDVISVVPPVTADAPLDSKGLGLVAIGGLVVKFAARSEILREIVNGVRSWVSRQHSHSVKLTLDGDTCEVTGASSEEQEKLIELWIARHASAG